MKVYRQADDITSEAFYIDEILLRGLCELDLAGAGSLEPAGQVHPTAERRLRQCCAEAQQQQNR